MRAAVRQRRCGNACQLSRPSRLSLLNTKLPREKAACLDLGLPLDVEGGERHLAVLAQRVARLRHSAHSTAGHWREHRGARRDGRLRGGAHSAAGGPRRQRESSSSGADTTAAAAAASSRTCPSHSSAQHLVSPVPCLPCPALHPPCPTHLESVVGELALAQPVGVAWRQARGAAAREAGAGERQAAARHPSLLTLRLLFHAAEHGSPAAMHACRSVAHPALPQDRQRDGAKQACQAAHPGRAGGR